MPDHDVHSKDDRASKSTLSEIDDIFAAKGRKAKITASETTTEKKGCRKDHGPKTTKSKVEVVVASDPAPVKRKQPPPPSDDDGFGDTRGKKSKRFTEEGYPIFDVKELRIGEGGDTDQCPFDCDCCY